MTKTFALLAEVGPAEPAKDGKPSAGPIYRAAIAKDGFPVSEMKTSYDSFQASAKKFPTRPCLGYRPIKDGSAQPYEWITYSEVAERATALSSALQAMGLKPQERLGVCGANSVEYMVTLQACNCANLCGVALYDTLGDDAVEYIVKHSETKIVATSAAKLPSLAKVLPIVKDNITHGVIYWGEADAKIVAGLKEAGLKVQSLAEAEAAGLADPRPHVPPAAEDLLMLLYTSGTTGTPKGVMLTHRALMAHVVSLNAFLEDLGETLDENDTYFSFLTLAHSFGRVADEMLLNLGAGVAYWQGDARKLMDDVLALKPTFFASVPRVLERVYAGIQEMVAKMPLYRRAIFNYAYSRKLFFMKWGWKVDQASHVSDWLVFNKVKAKMGGRVRLILTGGAPLAPTVEEFMQVVMGAPTIQGYGLTESCAASFVARPHRMDHIGCVGPPTPATEFRLVSVPDMGYDALGPQPAGELCIRGPGLFSGYLKEPELTKEAVDEDGFLLTGDIATIAHDGVIKIIDRKKNMFKLSQGEYVAAEKLEVAYSTSHSVEQVWVYGNSFEAVLVAVVVPEGHALKVWAKEQGLEGKTREELCALPEAAAWMLKELHACGKEQRLKGFEVVKAVHLSAKPFSVENDLMTPTLKLKRAPLLKYYQEEIGAMYAKLRQTHK